MASTANKADINMSENDLNGWTKVSQSTLPEPLKKVLLIDAYGRRAIGSLIARADMKRGDLWEVNGTSGPIVKPPLFWRDYPELPVGYDY